MLTVASAVEQIVFSSDFAIEGLQNGCLNLSAYADVIKPRIEAKTRKPVQKGSIVVALARLSRTYQAGKPEQIDFQVYDITSRSGLTEVTYAKTLGLQKSIAHILEGRDVQTAPFFVARVGIGETSIITHDALAQSIRVALDDYMPTLHLQGLSSLTLQVTIETIDMPRQSYTVIKQLALRNINCVEYITSPSELTLILHNDDLKDSFAILHDKFSQ